MREIISVQKLKSNMGLNKMVQNVLHLLRSYKYKARMKLLFAQGFGGVIPVDETVTCSPFREVHNSGSMFSWFV